MPLVTAADLALHMGVQSSAHQGALNNAVAAANGAVARYCGRSFDRIEQGQETARVFYPTHAGLAMVDDFWSATNLVVKTDEDDDGTFETTWVTADFVTEPLNGRSAGGTVPWDRIRAVDERLFPVCVHRPSVQVTAAWGWAMVPADVFTATLIKAARLFHRKDSPQGVAGFGEFGVVRIGSREDADVMMLLAPFRGRAVLG